MRVTCDVYHGYPLQGSSHLPGKQLVSASLRGNRLCETGHWSDVPWQSPHRADSASWAPLAGYSGARLRANQHAEGWAGVPCKCRRPSRGSVTLCHPPSAPAAARRETPPGTQTALLSARGGATSAHVRRDKERQSLGTQSAQGNHLFQRDLPQGCKISSGLAAGHGRGFSFLEL